MSSAGALPGLAELGVTPTTLEAMLPDLPLPLPQGRPVRRPGRPRAGGDLAHPGSLNAGICSGRLGGAEHERDRRRLAAQDARAAQPPHGFHLWNDFAFRDDDIDRRHLRQVRHHLDPADRRPAALRRATRTCRSRDISPWLDLRVMPPEAMKLAARPRPTAGSSRPTCRWTRWCSRRRPSTSTSAATAATCCGACTTTTPTPTPEWYELLNDTPGRVGPPIGPPDPDIRRYFRTWLEQRRLSVLVVLGEHRHLVGGRATCPNVKLVHFTDLKADLAGEMRAIADFLEIDIAEARWPTIVEHCTFDYMKAHADRYAPLGGMPWEGGGDDLHQQGHQRPLARRADAAPRAGLRADGGGEAGRRLRPLADDRRSSRRASAAQQANRRRWRSAASRRARSRGG